MGLDYDRLSAQINSNKLYFQGRYFLGFGHVFIKFPRQSEIFLFKEDSVFYTRSKVSLIIYLWMD